MRNEMGRGSEGYLAGVRAGLPFALVAGVVAISSRRVNLGKETKCGHEEDRGAGRDADDRGESAHLDSPEKTLCFGNMAPRATRGP